MGIPDPARVITTAAIDVHLPNNPSQMPSSLVSADGLPSACHLQRTSSCVSDASAATFSSFSGRHHSLSSHTLGDSVTDCSSTVREASTSTDDYSGQRCYPPPYSSPLALGPDPVPRGGPANVATVQELLSSLSDTSSMAPKGLDPVNLKPPSPELEHRLNLYNKRNQELRPAFCTKPLIHLQSSEPLLEEKYRMMEQGDGPISRLAEA